MNMKQAQVPPDVAFAICGLFSDPNDVYSKGQKYFGENFWKFESKEESSKINDSTFNKEEDKNKKKENQSIKKNPASGDNNQPHKLRERLGKNGSVRIGVELGKKN